MAIKTSVGYGPEGTASFGGPLGDPYYYSGPPVVARSELLISVSGFPTQINAFESRHMTLEGSRLTGAAGVLYWRNWPTGLQDVSVAKGTPPDTNESLGSWLAGTNPARANVLLPVFGLELRDIPMMVKEMGLVALKVRDGIIKSLKGLDSGTAAKANLAFQFGWQPFVSDLWKMVSFQEAVEKRRKELSRLSSGKGLRMRRDSPSVTDHFTMKSYPLITWGGAYIAPDIEVTRTIDRWVVGWWKPTSPSSVPQSDAGIRRLLTGTDPGNIAANVWAALPWSWFTDYFYNVGQLIDASNRTVATPHLVSVMTRHRHVLTHKASGGLTAGVVTTTTHERGVGLGYTASAGMPTLGAGQLSILGSLAVVKNPRVTSIFR